MRTFATFENETFADQFHLAVRQTAELLDSFASLPTFNLVQDDTFAVYQHAGLVAFVFFLHKLRVYYGRITNFIKLSVFDFE